MPSFLLGDKPLQKIKSNAIIIVVAGFIVSIVLSAVTESNKLREMLRHSRVLLFQSRPPNSYVAHYWAWRHGMVCSWKCNF
jgi:hypothetical protein